MKLSELNYGEVSTLVLMAADTAMSEQDKGCEVRLVFPRTGNETTLAMGDRVVTVEPVDENSRRRLTVIRETEPTRLCWLAKQRNNKGDLELTVEVHLFHSKVHWTDGISFGVDERVVERVMRMTDRKMNVEEVCRWLADQVFLPPVKSDSPLRAIATGSPINGGPFRVLGIRAGIDVATHGETIKVDRVVTLRSRRDAFRPPEYLIEANLAFVDSTLAGQLRTSVRAQLERLNAEADRYIPLWEKYQSIERENLNRRAKEMGWLAYHSFEFLPNGTWRFIVSDGEAGTLTQFRDRLNASGHDEIEADREVPPELLEGTDDERGPLKRSAVGTVEQIRLDRREIDLRPLDEDSDALPPQKGVLFAAIQGNRTLLKRRELAVRRIKSADARMPQLGLILEGQSSYVRRTDRIDPFTSAAARVFRDTPTSEQRLAVDIAVNTPDIVVIQGPPGTGKTKVIAAIAARLAQIAADRPEVAGRTLLTSYQHDAVDHAASKSLVFGLPPIRFGNRRGEHRSDEQIQRWAVQARERVEGVLAGLQEDRPLAYYRSVRDRVASYAAGGLSSAEVRGLLDELIALRTVRLPTDVWERLQKIRNASDLAISTPDGIEQSLMRKATRGIRTTPEAFADDGPRKARQALSLLVPLLSEEQQKMLTLAAAVNPGGIFEDLNALAGLRDKLLDLLNPDTVPRDQRSTNLEVLDTLNAAVSALYVRLSQSPSGVGDALQEYAEALREDPLGVRDLLQHYATVYAVTCGQAVSPQVVAAKDVEQIADLEFENVIIDEAARANPLDLFIPMSLAKRRIILVGDHRQLPHTLDDDVEKVLAESVRDHEQHALKESLFERLFEKLQLLSRNDEVCRVVTLRDQFRMHPTLGRFVSDVFYEPHGEGFRSPRPAVEFLHNIPGYLRAGRPICAAWKDVSHREGAEQPGRSKSRLAEARWIAKEVRRLLLDVEANASLGVISFYRAQVDELLQALMAEGIAERDPESGEIEIRPEWRTLERSDGSREERLRVGTVDAFQGKEFDIVLLSATRSNTHPADSEENRRRKFGHLMLENRLCVAMSRQRLLLVVVGDRKMFATEEARKAVPGLSKFQDLCGGNDGLDT